MYGRLLESHVTGNQIGGIYRPYQRNAGEGHGNQNDERDYQNHSALRTPDRAGFAMRMVASGNVCTNWRKANRYRMGNMRLCG
jgi:hypothetical protein